MTALGLDSIREAIEATNPDNKKKNVFDTDGDGERQGNWKSRLKGLFGNKNVDGSKENKEEATKSKGILGWMKEHKGLSTGMILMGILGVLKATGITVGDVVKGVKTLIGVATDIGKGIKWAFDKISGAISGITKFVSSPLDTVKGWMGFEKSQEQVENESNIDSTAKLVTAGGLALGGMYAAKHPIKATSGAAKGIWKVTTFGHDVVKWIVDKIRGVPGSDKIIENADDLAKKIDKTTGTANKMLENLKKLKNRLTNPRVIKLVGKKAIAKVGAKLMSLGAGPIAILGILLGVWDMIWVGKYMLVDGLSFMDALCKQLLGHTWNDIEEVAEYTEDDEYAAKHKMLSALQNADTKKVKHDAEMEVIKNQPLDLISTKEYNQLVEDKYDQIQAERDAVARKAMDEYNHIRGARRRKEEEVNAPANNPGYNPRTMGDPSNSVNPNPANNENFSNMRYKQGVLDPKTVGSEITRTAASIATSRAHTKTTGKCARYVTDSMQRAGLNYPRLASAYMYATDKGLPSVGFEQLKVTDPNNYPKQPGDVYVIDSFVGDKGKKHPHGHIAIWNGQQWVSDFKQKNMNIYNDLPNEQFKKITSVWRLTDKGLGEAPNGDSKVSTSTPVTTPTKPTVNNNDALSGINVAMATNNSRDTTKYTTTRTAPNVNNQVLNHISTTLSKSLEVQLRMADTLDKIESISSKPEVMTVDKKKNTTANKFEKAPEYPINMRRNTYA